VACALLLGLTGYIPVLQGAHPRGYGLMAHMSGSGLFLGLLALAALVGPAACRGTLACSGLWLFLAAGFVSAASMVLSMTELLDFHGIEAATRVHRWAGIFTLAGLALLAASTLRTTPTRTHKP
jgi:hypothetical protein